MLTKEELEPKKIEDMNKREKTASLMIDSRTCIKPDTKLFFRGVRSSKFRHVYGQPAKRELCYENVNITKNAHESNFCAVNPKFIAIVTEVAGGGAFIVLPINSTGRVDINAYKVTGHTGPVMDIKWNPFDDNVIASCSDDCTIKLWYIPDGGLHSNLNEWTADLHGHKRRVGYIEWHPSANNVLASIGFDYLIIIWDVEKQAPLQIINCHNDAIQSLSFNRDGSRIATTCKDKKLRVIDPRTGLVISEGICHNGSSRSSKVAYLKNGMLATVGFYRYSDRQLAVWNENNLSAPVIVEGIDCSSGVIFPYFDYDTNILFLAGKGDGNIRYYEVVDSPPYIHFLNQFLSGLPQKSLGFMPKRGCDVKKCEIFRFYKLHTTKLVCEPISMIVPRKSDQFQDDLYPDTAAPLPSLTASDWMNGVNRPPQLMSMKSGAGIKTHKPMILPMKGQMNGNSDVKYHAKLTFLTNHTVPDYRPMDQRDVSNLVPDVIQNTIPTSRLLQSSQDIMEIEVNEKSLKTTTNQSTKFQQIKRFFGQKSVLEDKSLNKVSELENVAPKTPQQLQREYDLLREEVVLLRKQVDNRDKIIQDLENQVKKLELSLKGL